MHYDVSEYKNYGASRKNGLQKGGQNVKINFSFYLLSSRALLKFSSFYCCRSEDFFGKLFSKWRQPLHLAVDINFFRHKATAFFSANFFFVPFLSSCMKIQLKNFFWMDEDFSILLVALSSFFVARNNSFLNWILWVILNISTPFISSRSLLPPWTANFFLSSLLLFSYACTCLYAEMDCLALAGWLE